MHKLYNSRKTLNGLLPYNLTIFYLENRCKSIEKRTNKTYTIV